MNFALIHDTLRASLRAAGFRFWETQDWYDLEIGKLPEAAIQDGFTIRFVGQEQDPDLKSDTIARLTMEIEFALGSRKGYYAGKMATAQTAIRALRGVLLPEGFSIIDDALWPNFQCHYIGEIVAMTFTISFIIDSN